VPRVSIWQLTWQHCAAPRQDYHCTALDLSENFVDECAADNIGRHLKSLCSLARLDLQLTVSEDSIASAFAAHVTAMTGLQHLCFGGDMSADGAACMLQKLARPTTMVHLSTVMAGECSAEMWAAVAACTRLTSLQLSRTKPYYDHPSPQIS
jgi:hypothetical protein